MLVHCPVLGHDVFITEHAAERFIERCEPAFHNLNSAKHQIAHQLQHARLTCPPDRQRPDRIHYVGTFVYLHSGVGIVLGGRMRTVLAYGMAKYKKKPRQGSAGKHSGRRKRAQARLRSLRVLDSLTVEE